MFRLRLLAALTGALVAGLSVATIATARPFDDDDGPEARAYTFGVGNFGPGCWQTHGGPFCVPFDYSARLLGVQQRSGQGAWGVFERRNNVTGGRFIGRVTCMNVIGNRASIGGLLDAPAASLGDPFLIYVEDNGTPGTATPDQVSALATFATGEPLPVAGFPRICPTADSTLGYLPLTSGDITVSERAVNPSEEDD